MTLLAIDTSGTRCAALVRALGRDDVERVQEIGRGHDRALAPMVREALRAAAVAPRDLTRIGVVVGPGSFAGVRVGVAFARGLALALGAPAVGVNALDALGVDLEDSRCAAAVHDVRRGEVVWCAYRRGARWRVVDEHGDWVGMEPRRQSLPDARAALEDLLHDDGPFNVAGAGAGLLTVGPFLDTGRREPTMGAVADLAERAAPGAAPARPFYHRPPDAVPRTA